MTDVTMTMVSAPSRFWRTDDYSMRHYGTPAFGRETMSRMIEIDMPSRQFRLGAWFGIIPTVHLIGVAAVIGAVASAWERSNGDELQDLGACLELMLIDLHFELWRTVTRLARFPLVLHPRCRLCAAWHPRLVSCGAAQYEAR